MYTVRHNQNVPADKQSGFTIVELMIASLVFSVILLIITGSIIHITQLYYKGITATKTQNAARSIMDSVSQSIQFSGNDISQPSAGAASGRLCINSSAYDFQLGYQVPGGSGSGVDLQNPQALTLTTGVSGCSGAQAYQPGGTTSLLSQHMRLTKFSVQPVNGAGSDNLWQVSVTVIYGDYDQLCSTSGAYSGRAGGCDDKTDTSPATPAFLTDPNLHCRLGSGSAFCDISALSTVVQSRVGN